MVRPGSPTDKKLPRLLVPAACCGSTDVCSRADAHRKWRPFWGCSSRVLSQLSEHLFNCSVELRVLALGDGSGVLFDLDVWRYTHVFDDPAILGENGQIGRGHASSIHQDRKTENSDQAAPGSFTDELSQAEFVEHPRQKVAARSGRLVDDHDFGTENGRVRGTNRLPMAGCPVADERLA